MIATESLEFTRETLIGKPSRWLVMILLGLPWLALSLALTFLIGSDIKKIRWESIPYGHIILLAIAGVICSLFLWGYRVRILRGGSKPAEFDQWGRLAIDGFKMAILFIIWMLPAVFVGVLFGVLFYAGIGSPGSGFILLLSILLFAMLGLVWLVVLLIFVPFGLVRLARTGSIREGFAFSEILSAIGLTGWGNYMAGLIIIAVIWIAYSVISMMLQLIPLAGILICSLVLVPMVTVFIPRFISMLYDFRTDTVEAEPTSPAGSVPEQIQ